MNLKSVLDDNYLLNLPSVFELELIGDWFWHGDFGVSTWSSEDDFMHCDIGDEANRKFVVSNLDDSISGGLVLAVTPEIGWWFSTSVE